MIGTVKLSIGMVLFPVTYLMWTGITSLYLGVPGTLLYAFSLPFSGLFVLVYHERIIRKLPLWQSIVLRKYRSHLKRLADERALRIRLGRAQPRFPPRPRPVFGGGPREEGGGKEGG